MVDINQTIEKAGAEDVLGRLDRHEVQLLRDHFRNEFAENLPEPRKKKEQFSIETAGKEKTKRWSKVNVWDIFSFNAIRFSMLFASAGGACGIAAALSSMSNILPVTYWISIVGIGAFCLSGVLIFSVHLIRGVIWLYNQVKKCLRPRCFGAGDATIEHGSASATIDDSFLETHFSTKDEYADNKTEEAWFSFNGKVIKQLGPQLNDMYIITRNCVGGPPHCPCAVCGAAPPPPKPVPRVERDEWMDIREGDAWPTNRQLVRALDKSLDTLPGVAADQYVALWYMQGEPVMGRVWNEGGKIAANFSWFNNEYCKNVGSIQLLVHLPDSVRGFDYGWIPFPEAAKFGDKEWHPVHVNNHKGDISVGVVNVAGGKQIFAKVDVRNESYGYGNQGKEVSARGPACASSTIVLCRKAKPGYKLDG